MNTQIFTQYIIRAINLTLALSFASYLYADQNLIASTGYGTRYSEDIASFSHSHKSSSMQSDEKKTEFSFKENRKSNEDRVGSFFYKTIDDPDKVRNQVAGTAILYGLDSVGLGDSVREGVDFIKKNTRYSFGDCGDLRLKTGNISAASCLSDGGSVELNSSYDFDSVQLQFKWSL